MDDNQQSARSSISPSPIQGWPQLALLMAKTPDFAAFPRFRDLNIKSLLYYQVKLAKLRKSLHEQEYADSERTYANRADSLIDEEDSTQYKLIQEMRSVLKEYNEALLQFYQVSALPGPDAYNMLSLRSWLRGEYKVRGIGSDSWGDIYEWQGEVGTIWKQFWGMAWSLIWPSKLGTDDDLDLVVTKPQAKVDGLARWIVWRLKPFYKSLHDVRTPSDAERKQKIKTMHTMENWSKRALIVTGGVSMVVACLLPIVAITVLANLHTTRDLLLCLAGFTFIFVVGLMLLTRGAISRVELFTATAAFSAVLVVFISVPQVVILPISPPTASVAPAV